MMTNQAAGLSLLDHALNAVLDAQLRGPERRAMAVGLICFSDEIHGIVPPRGGMRPDEPSVARLVRPLSAAGRIALRPGLSSIWQPTAASVRWWC